jgi:hypothetical protein
MADNTLTKTLTVAHFTCGKNPLGVSPLSGEADQRCSWRVIWLMTRCGLSA